MYCTGGDPVGPYGAYNSKHPILRLCSGERIETYRVREWRLGRDSRDSVDVLQLEYEAPFAVDDTNAARHYALLLWPVFGRYVENGRFHAAMITATNLRRSADGLYSRFSGRSRSLQAIEEPDSAWVLVGTGDTLPPLARCPSAGIFESDGRPLRVRATV